MQGQLHRGTISATSPLEVSKQLREQGLFVVRLREQKASAPQVFLRPATRSLAVFFRHLYNTYRAGVPLSEALELFALTERSPLRPVAAYAAKRLREGTFLSQAVRETGFPFPTFVLPIIEAGERSGQLERVLGLLAEHFDREVQFEQEMKRGTIFAKAYMVFAVVVMLMLVSVFPVALLGSFAASLHLALRVLGGLIGFWVLWRLLGMIRWTAPYTEMVLVHLPFVSAPWRKLMAARFARTLSLLHAAGIPPHTSLELAAQASGSPWLMRTAQSLAAQLQRGEKFSQVASQLPFLPPLVIQMLATGERSGTIDESLSKAAEYLETEAQTGMKSLPIIAGFALYGFVILLLVFLILGGIGVLGGLYRGILQE